MGNFNTTQNQDTDTPSVTSSAGNIDYRFWQLAVFESQSEWFAKRHDRLDSNSSSQESETPETRSHLWKKSVSVVGVMIAVLLCLGIMAGILIVFIVSLKPQGQ